VAAKCIAASQTVGGTVDIYVRTSNYPLNKLFDPIQVAMHCYAVDCVTFALYGNNGTNTLDDPHDFPIKQELSYHHSLKSRF
jgi:hypothetical protein